MRRSVRALHRVLAERVGVYVRLCSCLLWVCGMQGAAVAMAARVLQMLQTVRLVGGGRLVSAQNYVQCVIMNASQPRLLV